MNKEIRNTIPEFGYTAFESAWKRVGAGLPETIFAPLTEQWIEKAIGDTVKLNIEPKNTPAFLPTFRPLPSVHLTWSINHLQPHIISPAQGEDTSSQVLSVLLNGNIRKGSRQLIEPYGPQFLDQIQNRVQAGLPIEIALPTLPAKNSNRLVSQLPEDKVDLGEHLLLAQMRDIALSIEQIYQPGAHIILLTDGIVYADIFSKGKLDKVTRHREACRDIRNALGLQSSVSLVDMAWITQRDPVLPSTQEQVKDMLRYMEGYNPTVQERLKSLRRGMLYNVPSQGYTFDEYQQFLYLPEDDLPSDLQSTVSNAALDYASFLLAMQQRRVVTRAFPHAIRGTVHPKDAPQLPLHLVGRSSVTFPYNGVPVVSESRWETRRSLRRAARIMRFHDLLKYPEAKAMHKEGEDHPFYYLVA